MTYLHALALLRNEHGRDIRLTVVGDGPLRPVAERYAQGQDLRARFVGEVSDPEQDLARAQLAFVSGYLAIWQALAMRRPVFAVYENELKRDYLLGFPEARQVLSIAGSAEELSAQLQRHLSDPSAAERRRDRGARLSAQHTWERVADLYLSMYRAHGVA